jgi:predicted nucleic acid-binding protein
MSGIKTCIDTNVFLNVIHRDPSFYSYSRKILSAIDRVKIEGIAQLQ